MNELTIEEQRVLAEALGERWHEKITGQTGSLIWTKCSCGANLHCEGKNPDFNDGRVTMRLMELVDEVTVIWSALENKFACRVHGQYWQYGETRAIAIAKAVFAFMAKEK